MGRQHPRVDRPDTQRRPKEGRKPREVEGDGGQISIGALMIDTIMGDETRRVDSACNSHGLREATALRV